MRTVKGRHGRVSSRANLVRGRMRNSLPSCQANSDGEKCTFGVLKIEILERVVVPKRLHRVIIDHHFILVQESKTGALGREQLPCHTGPIKDMKESELKINTTRGGGSHELDSVREAFDVQQEQ